MSESLVPYHTAMCALVGVAFLWLIQTLLLDYFSIRKRHIPGTPVTSGHADPLFRVTRAHANTNENLTAFGLSAFLAIALGGSPAWVNGLATAYFAARLAHMLTYYADLRLPRSVAFGAGLAATGGLALIAALSL